MYGAVTWQPVKNKDGTENRYAQTNGTHNIAAYRYKRKWYFEVWLITSRPHKRLAAFDTAQEARGYVDDLR